MVQTRSKGQWTYLPTSWIRRNHKPTLASTWTAGFSCRRNVVVAVNLAVAITILLIGNMSLFVELGAGMQSINPTRAEVVCADVQAVAACVQGCDVLLLPRFSVLTQHPSVLIFSHLALTSCTSNCPTALAALLPLLSWHSIRSSLSLGTFSQ